MFFFKAHPVITGFMGKAKQTNFANSSIFLFVIIKGAAKTLHVIHSDTYKQFSLCQYGQKASERSFDT